VEGVDMMQRKKCILAGCPHGGFRLDEGERRGREGERERKGDKDVKREKRRKKKGERERERVWWRGGDSQSVAGWSSAVRIVVVTSGNRSS
jgi:hypothetical protein